MSVSQMTYVVVKLRPFMTSQDLIVSSFMTYKLVCNKNTTTVATCGAGGTLHPSGALDFTAVLKLLVAKSLYFLCSVLLIVVCLFVCFNSQLYCSFFFDLRFLKTCLVSSMFR